MCVWSSVFVFVLVCITVCPFSCSNHLEEKDFVFIVSSMSCHFICSVALPHGAMGWSAVCDSGTPGHNRFLLHYTNNKHIKINFI